MKGRVHQLNIKPQTGKERGLPKSPVTAIVVNEKGVVGDFNKYRTERKAGDPEMAVLLYPVEMIRKLNDEGWPVKAGDLGENITTEGLGYDEFLIGERFRVGDVTLEVTKACDPCRNLRLLPYVGPERQKEFMQTLQGRRGWYARVVEGGELHVGDVVSKTEALKAAGS
jgi:MOSC domain-containing protein YiiM